jgi:N-acetylglucosaminyldiphosphoundecaprenol N-acetyl-beta-D-mannosaminyltransferase
VTAEVPTISLMGASIARLTRGEVVDHVFNSLAAGTGGWIITPNLDYLRRYDAEAETRELYAAADLVVADGIPLLWAARVQGTPLPDRVAGSDLVWLLTERAAETSRSIFLMGGDGEAAEQAAAIFTERWPGIRIAGISVPFVSDQPTAKEISRLREEISAAQPDLVYVALGAPKQERLIADLHSDFPTCWWVGVGISLSFVAGTVQRAPVWVQRAGLEWAHRMLQQPGRLITRYLVDDLPFLFKLLYRSLRARS